MQALSVANQGPGGPSGGKNILLNKGQSREETLDNLLNKAVQATLLRLLYRNYKSIRMILVHDDI